jgi:hypothetical protein
VVTIRRGIDCQMDLITTRTHHLKLQTLTELSLIFTVCRSPQHPLILFQPCVFKNRSLATTFNRGDSSDTHSNVINVRRISRNWVPGWWPFHTDVLVFCSQADFELTTGDKTLSLTNQLSHFTSVIWTGQSQSYVTANQFFLATSPLRLTTSNFIFQLNTWGYSPYVTSSLMKG